MQVGGAVALDVARVPGHDVAALAGDLVSAAGARVRRAAVRLAHEFAVALRARGPVMAALLDSLRGRSAPRLAAVIVRTGTAAMPRTAGSAGHRVPTGGDPARRRTTVLPPDATAPGRARMLLKAVAAERDVDDLFDDDDLLHDAAMVVTELVANAVDHARSASTLAVGIDHRGVYVAVRDSSPGPAPRPGPIDPAAPRGRGLQMVEALATAWGVTTHPDGKTVWAVLGRR